MERMGGTYSCMQRQRHRREEEQQNNSSSNRTRRAPVSETIPRQQATRSSLRHSVVKTIPDHSIEKLFPVDDNYVNVDNGLRSPKKLQVLATEAVARSLAYLDGELPPGLPPDVVDDIVEALVRAHALNPTSLRALKHCELSTLELAGARGVNDLWLEPFSLAAAARQHEYLESMDLDCPGNCDCRSNASSRSTSSFVSANSTLDDHDSGLHAVEKMDVIYGPYASTTANLTLLDLRGSPRLTDKGLLQLSHMTGLTCAKLDDCHAITGRGLLAFSKSHRLHTLSLMNCRRLTDEGIINISHLVSLRALCLDGCRCLTDRSLQAIGSLVGLRKLDLSQCDLLSDGGLEHLESIEGLEELSLGWCRSITNRGLDTLTSQPGRSSTLRNLRLCRCKITDEGSAFLGRLSALEELDLNGCCNLGSARLAGALEKLSKLRSLDVSYIPGILRTSWQGTINGLVDLDLSYAAVKDAHLSKFDHLPTLESLNLDSCLVGDWGIAHLANNDVVPNLKSLNLADTDFTDVGAAHLPKFKNLTRLSLFYCNISSTGLRYVAELIELEVLNLSEISDTGIAHLRNLKKLRCLDLFSGRITDSGCAHLSRMKSLESLELCGGSVGDLGCSLISGLQNLTSLNLSQNERITNRGATALAGLTKLKQLNLSNTSVNATNLRLPKSLQSLSLYGCEGIDGSGLSVLENELPRLKCLRVNSQNNEDGVMVGEIDEDVFEGLDPYFEGPPNRTLVAGPLPAALLAPRIGDVGPNGNENSMMEDDDSFYSDH